MVRMPRREMSGLSRKTGLHLPGLPSAHRMSGETKTFHWETSALCFDQEALGL